MDLVEQMRQNIKDAVRYITDRIVGEIEIGIILGSGLGKLVESVSCPHVFPYEELPHFPQSTIEGHAGNLVIGTLAEKRVAIMQGRFHYYEGYTSSGIAFPIRTLKALGAKILVVTCAVGGLRPDLIAGDILLIEDHINMMGVNPLVGTNDDEVGPRFVDMTDAYNKNLRQTAISVAKSKNIELKKGVYVGVMGPTYETPAEIRFLSQLGDVVGMSTVPEVIIARHAGLKVLGLAVVTNTTTHASSKNNLSSDSKIYAENHSSGISHEEVLEAAAKASDLLADLIVDILKEVKIEKS